MGKPKRPEPVEHAPLRLSAVRCRKTPTGIEWYWRARQATAEGVLQRAIGWARAGDLPELRRRADEVLDAGRMLDTRSASPAVDTFGRLLSLWYQAQQHRPIKATTLATYEVASQWLAGRLAGVVLSRMSTATLQRYADERVRSGAAPRTVRREGVIACQAWRWGVEVGHCPPRLLKVPNAGVRRGVYRHNHYTPTAPEVAAVIAKLSGPNELAVRIMATTGCRRGELVGLRHCDVDVRRRELVLQGKTGTRRFPLPAELLELLKPLASDSTAPLIDAPARRDYAKVLRDACAAAEVPRFTPHGLRRFVVDRLLVAGVDVGTGAQLLGHSPEVMLRAYRQPTEEDRRRAVSRAQLGELAATKGKVIAFPGQEE